VWCDVLLPHGAETVARFGVGPDVGQPVVTLHRPGKGCVIYVGTAGDRELVNTTLARAQDLAGIRPLVSPVADVEVTARWKDEQQLLFILNHSDSEQHVSLNQAYRDLISGQTTTDGVNVPAKDLFILVTP